MKFQHMIWLLASHRLNPDTSPFWTTNHKQALGMIRPTAIYGTDDLTVCILQAVVPFGQLTTSRLLAWSDQLQSVALMVWLSASYKHYSPFWTTNHKQVLGMIRPTAIYGTDDLTVCILQALVPFGQLTTSRLLA